MKTVISTIIKLFFIDTAILISILAVGFFLFTAVKAIKNGKKHTLTNDNIIAYCWKLFPSILGKYLKNILSWFFVFFIFHICFSLFQTFASYIRETGTYDKNPILAFLIDTIEIIVPIFAPFILPVVIILVVIILGYGLFATLHQIYKDEIDHDKMVSVVDSVEKRKLISQTNIPDELDLDSIEVEVSKAPENEEKKIPYKATGKQILFYFIENAQKAFFTIAKLLPKIVIIVAVCVGINSVFLSIKNVTTIVENQQRINELHMTVKNLSKSQGLARITLIKEEKTGNTVYPLKTYKIEILDSQGDAIPSQTQEVTLRGDEIYIDAININFEYSEISKGEKFNIAYPYRVYSETMAPNDGIPLACMYEDGKTYPVIYSLATSEIYGMKENVFFTRLAEIFDIIKDENLSKEMGIRSVVGVANHFTMKKNEIRDMFIEGTGGIRIKKHQSLFDEDSENSIKISLGIDRQ